MIITSQYLTLFTSTKYQQLALSKGLPIHIIVWELLFHRFSLILGVGCLFLFGCLTCVYWFLMLIFPSLVNGQAKHPFNILLAILSTSPAYLLPQFLLSLTFSCRFIEFLVIHWILFVLNCPFIGLLSVCYMFCHIIMMFCIFLFG